MVSKPGLNRQIRRVPRWIQWLRGPRVAVRTVEVVPPSARGYLTLSILTAFAAGIGGLFISSRLLVPSGGAVVLAMSGLFFVTLAFGWLRSA